MDWSVQAWRELRKEDPFRLCSVTSCLMNSTGSWERRGHRFVRYADDCNIYVRSEQAGQRVMESVKRFISKRLKLKVNEQKSAVARPQVRKFLGFSFSAGPVIRRTIAPQGDRTLCGSDSRYHASG